MGTIENDLAEYVLKLSPCPDLERYKREAYAFWAKEYGEIVARRVQNLVEKGRK